MSHRLDVAPLTPIDRAIMHGIRARWGYPLNRWYQYSDRTDAALMWSMVALVMDTGYTIAVRQEVLALYFGDPLCGLMS